MIEQVALAILGIAMAYLISEINQMQRDIRKLLLDVAILKDREQSGRNSDRHG